MVFLQCYRHGLKITSWLATTPTFIKCFFVVACSALPRNGINNSRNKKRVVFLALSSDLSSNTTEAHFLNKIVDGFGLLQLSFFYLVLLKKMPNYCNHYFFCFFYNLAAVANLSGLSKFKLFK